jgi:hypothetical protein
MTAVKVQGAAERTPRFGFIRNVPQWSKKNDDTGTFSTKI